MNNATNYYDILGIQKNSSFEQIKQAYRKVVKQYHPDNNKSKEAEELIKKIYQAYSILSNNIKREQYDCNISKENSNYNETVDKEELKKELNQILNSVDLYQFRASVPENYKIKVDYLIALKNRLQSNKYGLDNIAMLRNIIRVARTIPQEVEVIKNQIYQTSNEIVRNNEISTEINNDTDYYETTSDELIISNPDENIFLEKEQDNMIQQEAVLTIEKQEKQDINPIKWYDLYAEEIKNDKSLNKEQIIELVNYVYQLKNEFISLFASFRQIYGIDDKEKINEAIENTKKLVENKKNELLVNNELEYTKSIEQNQKKLVLVKKEA